MNKKFRMALFALLCLLIVITGCRQEEHKSSSSGSDITIADNTQLEVYCLETANISNGLIQFRKEYPDVQLKIKKFSTSQEMEDDLINRINTKNAPEVVLFDHTTTLDFTKLSKEGAFYNMTPFIESDDSLETENYLPAIESYFSSNKDCFYLPFSVMPLVNCSSKTMMETWNINQGQTTLEEYFTAAIAHDQENASDPFSFSFYRHTGYFDTIPLMLSISGLDISAQMESVGFKDSLEKVIDYAMFIDAQDQKALTAKETKWDAVNWPNVFCISNASNDLAGNIAMWTSSLASFYEDNMGYFVLPSLSDSQITSSMLCSWGSVVADCDTPEMAYSFLRCMMDNYEVGPNNTDVNIWYSPVEKEAMQKRIKDCTLFAGRMNDGTIVQPLSQETADDVLDIWESVGIYIMPNPRYNDFINTAFLEYFQGTASFDSCYDQFLNKISLYAME